MATPGATRNLGSIVAEVTVTNRKAEPVSFVIPKGNLIEIADPKLNYQNMVVSEDVPVTLPANATQTVKVRGMCANPGKQWPTNNASGNITPYRFGSKFSSQQDVWRAFGTGLSDSKKLQVQNEPA